MVWGCGMWPQWGVVWEPYMPRVGGVCLVLCYIPRYLWT